MSTENIKKPSCVYRKNFSGQILAEIQVSCHLENQTNDREIFFSLLRDLFQIRNIRRSHERIIGVINNETGFCTGRVFLHDFFWI